MRDPIREQAVANVDRRHGYTVEFSASPEAHRQDYDEEEGRLRTERLSVAMEESIENLDAAAYWLGLPDRCHCPHPIWSALVEVVVPGEFAAWNRGR